MKYILLYIGPMSRFRSRFDDQAAEYPPGPMQGWESVFFGGVMFLGSTTFSKKWLFHKGWAAVRPLCSYVALWLCGYQNFKCSNWQIFKFAKKQKFKKLGAHMFHNFRKCSNLLILWFPKIIFSKDASTIFLYSSEHFGNIQEVYGSRFSEHFRSSKHHLKNIAIGPTTLIGHFLNN